MKTLKEVRELYVGFYTSKLWTAQIEAAMQAYAEEYHKDKTEVKNFIKPDVSGSLATCQRCHKPKPSDKYLMCPTCYGDF